MKESFNQVFGHAAFMPAFIAICALDVYFDTRNTYLFVGGVVLLAYSLALAYSLVIVFLLHFRRPKTDDSGQSKD